MDQAPDPSAKERPAVQCVSITECSRKDLMLKNITHGTHIDHLEQYIDSVTGLSSSDGDYQLLSKSEGTHVITFKSPLGSSQLDKIKTKILETKFCEMQVDVEEVLPSGSVIIRNIDDDKRDEQFLKSYFSDPGSCGVSGIDNVELLSNGVVIVHFKDLESVQALWQSSHSQLGSNIELSSYDTVNGHKEIEPAESVHCIVREVPRVVACFVQKCVPSDWLKLHATTQIIINDTAEEASIHMIAVKGSKQVGNWNEQCQDDLEQFLQILSSHKFPVQADLLPTVQNIVQEKKFDCSVFVEVAQDLSALHVAGYKENVANFVEELKHIEDTELHKQELITLDAKKIALIEQTLIDVLHKGHPNVNFTVSSDDSVVIVTGSKQHRENFRQSVSKIKVIPMLVNVDQVVLDYLSTSHDHVAMIRRLLRGEQEQFAVYFDEELYILATIKSTAIRVAKFIEQTIHYAVIRSTGDVFEEEHFTKLCEQYKTDHVVDVTISPFEIRIIGDIQDVASVEQELRKHIQLKYWQKKTLEVSNGMWRFISLHLTKQLDEIQSRCERNSNIKAKFPKDTASKPEIVLEGEESLITALFEEINALIATVSTNDPPLSFDLPGIFEVLNTEEAFAIEGIEHKVCSCIEVMKKPVESGNVDDFRNEVCKGITKEGKRVILIEGNIEDFEVDVMVNAANRYLQHVGGVAFALSKKGGPRIQEDSNIYSGAVLEGDAIIRDEVGKLPCKKLIHAVGPMWRDDGKVEEVLAKTCLKCLSLGSKYRSIAFPAISSGIFKFPLEVSASVMIQAFCKWSEEFPNMPLHDIYVVVHNNATSVFTDVIRKFISNFWNARSTVHADNVLTGRAIEISPPETDVPSAIKITPPIKLYKGDLLHQQAEAYVNTVSNDLLLSNGVVSRSILKAAGHTLQDQCKQYIASNGRPKVGDVVVTGAGNISSKCVIHTVGAIYNASNASKSERVLEGIILKCLEVCEEKEASSIAFPALGAGNLRYPPTVVARIMISTVHNYYQAICSTSCIKEVKFVIFMDELYQIFERLLQHPEPTVSVGPLEITSPVAVPDESSTTITDTVSSPPSRGDKSVAMVSPIKLCRGDLLNEQAEVYVNTVSNDLLLSNGVVSRSILKAAGHTLQDQCKQYIASNGRPKVGDVVVTGAGNISSKCVIHTVGAIYNASNASKSERVLEGIILKCLEVCEEKEASSIAFPALGAGNLRYPPTVVARIMISTVHSYYQAICSTSCIKEVKFVIFMDELYQIFERLLQQHFRPSVAAYEEEIPNLLPIISSPHAIKTFRAGAVMVEIVCGDISNDDSDVIVNTTQPDLDLKTSTLLQKAGPAMQRTCLAYIDQYKKLEEGKICVTPATGRLKCKEVFHVVAPNKKNTDSINQAVTTCLYEAESNKMKSIAIPAIGTEGLSHMPEVAAQRVCEAVINFGQTNPSVLKQIRIAVCQEDMHQVFISRFTKALSTESNRLCGKTMHSARSKEDNAKLKSDVPSEHKVSAVLIKVYAKDPEAVQKTEDNLSQYINKKFESFALDNPGISQLRPDQILKLKQAADGLNLMVDVDTKLSQIQIKGRKDNVGDMKAVIMEMLSEIDREAMIIKDREYEMRLEEASKRHEQLKVQLRKEKFEKEAQRKKAIESEVRLKREAEEKDLIFVKGVNEKLRLKKEAEELVKEASEKEARLKREADEKEARFKEETREKEEQLKKASEIQEQLKKEAEEKEILLKKDAIEKARLKKESENKEVLLKKEAIEKARLKKEAEEKEALLKKEASEKVARLKREAEEKEARLKEQAREKEEQLKKASEREKQLKKEAEEKQERFKKASALQKEVKWQYLKAGKYEDYNCDDSYEIEQAYRLYEAHSKPAEFKYKKGSQECKVLFDKIPMKEVNCISKEEVIVQRIDMKEFPSSWEQTLQTEKVTLSLNSSEYNSVKKGFESTVPGRTFIKIERVQNPALYTQYIGSKRIMDKTNPPGTINERRLYHGCAEDAVENICQNGFNRSYANSGSLVGKGAYFAPRASYSADNTYSRPGASGNKHMFVARVLTGEYTRGDSGLKEPPAKNPSKSKVILYDSVVDNMNNPNMFVVFYDARCYPEYLITFR